MDNAYPVVAALCLLGLAIRTGYELLKQAGRVDAKSTVIFAVVFVAMCLMLASWPVMCPLDPGRIAAPGIVRWIGLGLVVAALTLAIGGLARLRGSASSSGWCASATSSIGGGWRKRRWNHTTERTIGAIAGEPGSDLGGADRARPRRRAFTLGASAILAVCLCLSSRCPPAAAQAVPSTPAAADPDSARGYSATTSVGFFVLGTVFSVYSHETGHWVVAHLTGATSAHMSLFPPGMRARFPATASTFQRTFPGLAGALTTRFLSEGIDHVLNTTSPSRAIEAIGGATYLAMRSDLPFQVLQSTVRQFFPGADTAHDDIAAGFVLPYFRTRRARNLVYAALVASQVIDVWLDAGEFADNYQRLTGHPRAPRHLRQAGLHLVPDPSSRSLGVLFHARF